jgi:FAD/FMN-containing dehydrogenase
MNLPAFRSEIGNISHTDDPAQVLRKSRDFTNSPILKQEAEGKVADLFVSPRSKAEVIQVARACARHRVPLVARGGGTANFGQGVPLARGIILDMTQLTQTLWVKDRRVRCEPGILMLDLDLHLQEKHQLELRMHPSTRKTATLGGYGILHDRGNIVGLEAVSVEEEPKIIELRGTDVNRLHHAYGTNGIITEMEMPLAPAYRWLEAIVEFDTDFMRVVRFLMNLCEEHGVITKLASGCGWPLPKCFHPLAHYVTPGHHTAHVMVADEFREIFHAMVGEAGGRLVYDGLEGKGPFKIPLYEFSFGHVRRYVDPSLIANFGVFQPDDVAGCIERIHHRFPDAPFALDMKRKDGALIAQGSPYFPYRGPDDFAKRIEEFQSLGYLAANVHTFFVKENGMKVVDEAELAFKRKMDPHNLMNPGKFSADEVANPGVGASLPSKGWGYRAAGELTKV